MRNRQSKVSRRDTFLAKMERVVPWGELDLGREPAPDETTVCEFRHLLEAHHLGDRLFTAVGEHLARQGLKDKASLNNMRQRISARSGSLFRSR